MDVFKQQQQKRKQWCLAIHTVESKNLQNILKRVFVATADCFGISKTEMPEC